MGIFITGDELPSGATGDIQVIFLLLIYGFILSKSSALISDGSELLLLIPSLAGIVGSVVLPVLGAVPDGAIVLFSGFGTKAEAQAQLSVGVGALAGSTIMLLTIPWALCIIMGRVDIVNGQANYKEKPKARLTRGYSLTGTGVTPRASIFKNGIIMIVTSISYCIIQISAFTAKCDTNKGEHCKGDSEHWVALIALLICAAAFAAYLWYNVKHADDEDKEDFIAEVKKQAIESHIISLSAAFDAELAGYAPASEKNLLLPQDEHERRFKETLKSFFNRYDRNGDGVIDPYELKFLLKDIGESMSEEKFQQFLAEIDTDHSGTISFPEFSVAMKRFITSKTGHGTLGSSMANLSVQQPPAHPDSAARVDNEEEDEEEEEEEVPEDLANLPPAEQKKKILLRAAWMMGLGTVVTVIFSDPMVDVLNNMGERFHVGAFYVAFVLAPLASNASELIASINYATRKTKKTITISLAALEGAACMNNTFCLGIFLCLIFFRGLVWEFSAETIAIIMVETALFLYSFKRTHTILDGCIILCLYPLSIFTVWFLENVAGLN